jgi:signal peptidase I
MSVDREARKSARSETWDFAKVVVQAVALAMVVRVFFYQPFNIPSGSMESTLLVGDYLFVSKLSYGYSKYSFPREVDFQFLGWHVNFPIPFAPDFSGRALAFGNEPQRGDVAVFRLPRDNETDYIKRVIGLPGDTVQMIHGVLYINGEAIPKEPAGFWTVPYGHDAGRRIPRFRETLPNGVSYFVLDRTQNGALDTTPVFTVPPGHYFMMGDNRDNSSDSRDPGGGVGMVPAENFIGKARIIFFSAQYEQREHWTAALKFWEWPWRFRWSRFFDIVY